MNRFFIEPLRVRLTLFAFCCLFLFPSCSSDHQDHWTRPSREFRRIISFAPSITETLFALSLGDRVAGVSSFCKYPPEVKNIPRVGGLIDPNLEKVLRLAPDLVILLKEHEKLIDFLKKNRIEYLTVDNHNCRAILESFRMIGEKCGRSRQADSLVRYVQKEIADGAHQTADAPKALLCVDRDRRGEGSIGRIYAAGPSIFYNDLLIAAGMKNILSNTPMEYPQLSIESVIRLQPDIIIDISSYSPGASPDACRDWRCLREVKAVKNNSVFCLSGDYMTIPGPRVFLLLKDFKRIVSFYRKGERS